MSSECGVILNKGVQLPYRGLGLLKKVKETWAKFGNGKFFELRVMEIKKGISCLCPNLEYDVTLLALMASKKLIKIHVFTSIQLMTT